MIALGASHLAVALVLAGCGSGSSSFDPGEEGQGTSGGPLPAHLAEHPAFEGVRLPLISGHGGAKRLCAENTLECFRLAIDEGAEATEADLQVLGDGTLVMFHDDDALQQTGEELLLLDADLATMRTLDAGWGFSPDGGVTFPLRGQGLAVSTFREFLDAFPGLPVLLDVKPESPEMAAALVAFVRDDFTEADRERVYVKANDQAVTDALRALDPAPRVAFSSADRATLIARLALGLDGGRLEDVGPSWIDLGREIPALGAVLAAVGPWARDHGHVLTASTIDDPAQMQALLDGGEVDGLVTNRPDLLRELLGR